MSARRIHVKSDDPADLAFFEDCRVVQVEMLATLDKLELNVREAKNLVHQTQVKVEELAESIDGVEHPVKDKPKGFK